MLKPVTLLNIIFILKHHNLIVISLKFSFTSIILIINLIIMVLKVVKNHIIFINPAKL